MLNFSSNFYEARIGTGRLGNLTSEVDWIGNGSYVKNMYVNYKNYSFLTGAKIKEERWLKHGLRKKLGIINTKRRHIKLQGKAASPRTGSILNFGKKGHNFFKRENE